MRHPLTGGGMTVAFHDCLRLARAFAELGPGQEGTGDWSEVERRRQTWEKERKDVSSTVNILSIALYDLFGAEGKSIRRTRPFPSSHRVHSTNR
jgi:squalene monooxygenase